MHFQFHKFVLRFMNGCQSTMRMNRNEVTQQLIYGNDYMSFTCQNHTPKILAISIVIVIPDRIIIIRHTNVVKLISTIFILIITPSIICAPTPVEC